LTLGLHRRLPFRTWTLPFRT